MHIYPCWPGWSSDGKCLLGTLLLRTFNSTRWHSSKGQDDIKC
ncbi:unnamed protein product [Staurois parvus]|uniref:Uncharacterized protein n=1 Tax=Staurois parvus TaxID=386267 RepID=A0ABN9EYQ7_9NEOB|nr:unnamed protein product [Staurois parvus]